MPYLVYKHTTPSNKVYIGITSKIDPNDRWQNGWGYYDNRHFYSAILKYGWSNIKHEIVASELSAEEAGQLEIDLIKKYNSTDPEHGHNIMQGGQYNTVMTPEIIEKLRQKSSERWKDATYRQNMIDKLTGHEVSEETRRKIGDANRGNHQSGGWNRGRKLTEEQKKNLYGHTPWCKGKTKETDERIVKLAQKLKGREIRPEWIEAQKAGMKKRYANGYAPVWINNGKEETLIDISTHDIPEGWVRGRLSAGLIYIMRGSESKKIHISKFAEYESQGWVKGRPQSVNKHIRKSLQKYIWMYEDKEFNSGEEVAQYLRHHGYPTIVESTVNNIVLNKKTEWYSELIDKISRREVTK